MSVKYFGPASLTREDYYRAREHIGVPTPKPSFARTVVLVFVLGAALGVALSHML